MNTDARFKREKKQCEREIAAHASNMGLDPIIAVMSDMGECLEDKGYVKQ